jgi:hypothetical protein
MTSSVRRSIGRCSMMVAAVVLVASCNLDSSLDFSSERNYAFVTIPGAQRSTGEYRTQPTAEFFRGSIGTIPNSSVIPDTCGLNPNFTETSSPLTGLTDLTAGASITLEFDSGTETLLPEPYQGRTRYELPADASAPYTPGDSVVVTIPGGAFPATTLEAKTAEPFTITGLSTPAAGENMQLQWTPADDNQSGMIISLRYAAPGTGSALNREVRCFFVDNGADSVPTRFAQLWASPTVTRREAVATRLRTRIVSVSGALAEVISFFQVPTPIVP